MTSTASPEIHPTAVVGPGVEIGERVSIGPHATVLGPCRIGDDVFIGSSASIGGPPEVSSLRQNRAWTGDLDHAGVIIESGAVIRDLVVIHQGSVRPTRVGAGAWLLNMSYLAHDVSVGAGAVISAGVRLGGHSFVGDGANLGMNVAVHQRRSVGHGAMVGMGTPVSRDVPPFALVYGTPPRLRGVNAVALKRLGVDEGVAGELAAEYSAGDLSLDALEGVDVDLVLAARRWWSELPDLRAVRVGAAEVAQ
ncbi:acyl-ACP--UDP-N- acetylglucosamine O-acyltransferase [Naasia sp. SYSU D00948]|uniref:acyl-ACP--UDP-N- acetylglucosamine O-acyltransferase n=1 Tax=Naasia sp. SYSU D00948 TaxID=2817379 RepID=UPI001B304880|nr:acyl-ACP--UDP-N- acetylglucosamine O-acyltransferase [Naasia sp. SYSU D00948]